MKLIGVCLSPRAKCPGLHTLPDGFTTSQPLSHSPSFTPDEDEDTHTHKKEALQGLFLQNAPLLIKYAYGSSVNYGQLNFHKAKKKKKENRLGLFALREGAW